MTHKFRDGDFYFLRFLNLFRFFEPRRLITHKHFSMLDERPVNPEVSPSLHPYSGSILTIIKPRMDTLLRSSSFGGMYSQANGYFFHSSIKDKIKTLLFHFQLIDF